MIDWAAKLHQRIGWCQIPFDSEAIPQTDRGTTDFVPKKSTDKTLCPQTFSPTGKQNSERWLSSRNCSPIAPIFDPQPLPRLASPEPPAAARSWQKAAARQPPDRCSAGRPVDIWKKDKKRPGSTLAVSFKGERDGPVLGPIASLQRKL